MGWNQVATNYTKPVSAWQRMNVFTTWALLAITVTALGIHFIHQPNFAHAVPSLTNRAVLVSIPADLAVLGFAFNKNWRKRAIFDLFLCVSRCMNRKSHVEITENVTLGRIPLAGDNLEDFGAFVSILEDEEMRPGWAGGFHVDGTEAQQYRIRTPDMGIINVEKLDEAADAIHETTGKVYVHCKSGVSRSAMAVIAYLIKYKGMSPRKAYQHVKNKRRLLLSSAHLRRIDEFAAEPCGQTRDFITQMQGSDDRRLAGYMGV